MAFDEVRLPLRVAYGAKGGPQFLTEVVSIQNGFERRNQCWSQARRRFDARTGIVTATDASVLLAFFLARGGRARGFRLRDWSDYSSAADGFSAPDWRDQVIGSGDDVTTQFQLIKTYNGVTRSIRKPVAESVRIGIEDVELLSGWSIDETTGVVTFVQPPASGAQIKAGFFFDVPVRFETDQLQIEADAPHAQQAEIPLIEVRV